MLLQMFTVYDAKAESFLNPFFMNAKGEAIRAFTDLANDNTHQFGKYPEDFTLFSLGQFNNVSATFLPHKAPVPIGTALEFVRS